MPVRLRRLVPGVILILFGFVFTLTGWGKFDAVVIVLGFIAVPLGFALTFSSSYTKPVPPPPPVPRVPYWTAIKVTTEPKGASIYTDDGNYWGTIGTEPGKEYVRIAFSVTAPGPTQGPIAITARMSHYQDTRYVFPGYYQYTSAEEAFRNEREQKIVLKEDAPANPF